ncbi:mitochondrial translation initiation factor [Niveomyces insectorum RCEF 264]|uniref:Translation initiation factor IF-2, mitochondrial n=1 Tax=Niveomyces insectorum RCEF 264 TaxID=1081102 RepID=A0A167SQL3_9HYPO|nr:mitochondrial translation initiation factor [Niveomyces insectorum RCEF 264]
MSPPRPTLDNDDDDDTDSPEGPNRRSLGSPIGSALPLGRQPPPSSPFERRQPPQGFRDNRIQRGADHSHPFAATTTTASSSSSSSVLPPRPPPPFELFGGPGSREAGQGNRQQQEWNQLARRAPFGRGRSGEGPNQSGASFDRQQPGPLGQLAHDIARPAPSSRNANAITKDPPQGSDFWSQLEARVGGGEGGDRRVRTAGQGRGAGSAAGDNWAWVEETVQGAQKQRSQRHQLQPNPAFQRPRRQRDREEQQQQVPQRTFAPMSLDEGVMSSSYSPSDMPDPAFGIAHHRKGRKQKAYADKPAKTKPARIQRRQRANELDEDEDYDEEMEERIERRRQRKEERRRRMEEEAAAAASAPTPILLPAFISVANLGTALRVKPQVFLSQLGELGFDDISLESVMTGETAALVAQEYGFEPTVDAGAAVDLKARPPPEDPSQLPARPPIVTIMGHVDHGKTTMLDWLRKSSVAAQEHGGITQHIGAFSVRLAGGKQITFLDTPGHAAFLTMRQRGAHVTDIVVLVVAADDSVKPQTLEALKHARAAKVPVVVAINKVDKDEARVDQVKGDLARHGVEIEDYGGDVQVVCVSGRTGQGMPALEEALLTLAEILDVRAERDGLAEGWVLESSIKPIGRAASVLVKRGTLRHGDIIAAGTTWAKIRMLRNEAGTEIEEAPPGTPVEILGWRDLPGAGDEVLQAPTEARAKEAVAYRRENKAREQAVAVGEAQDLKEKERAALVEAAAAAAAAVPHEGKSRRSAAAREEAESAAAAAALQAAAEENAGPMMVNFTVKGDVMGSVEAVCAAIQEIGSNEVRPHVLRAAPGAVTEFDVEHAAATQSAVISFNAPVASAIKKMALDAGVPLLEHTVIYHLIDDVKDRLSDRLAPTVSSKVLGEAEVLQVFPINVKGRIFKNIAGCRVRNGQVTRGGLYRVFRKGEQIHEGKLEALKQGKKDVSEMRKGTECGMSFEDWGEMAVGDKIQAYEEIREKRRL